MGVNQFVYESTVPIQYKRKGGETQGPLPDASSGVIRKDEDHLLAGLTSFFGRGEEAQEEDVRERARVDIA